MHPSREELAGLVFGTLDEDTAHRVADHVEHCPQCETTLRSLDTVEDDVIRNLRQPVAVGAFENEANCRQLVSQVEAIGRDRRVLGVLRGGSARPGTRP